MRELSDLQSTLNRSGFESGRPDGFIGPKTIAAVTRFQTAWAGGRDEPSRSLAVDGIPGPQTRDAARTLPWLSRHFRSTEFACRHCKLVVVHRQLVRGLEQLRASLGGRPLVIVSGHRCAVHNRRVGGATGSQHLWGTAADLDYVATLRHVQELGVFSGIGHKSGRVRHVDVRHARSSTNLTPSASPTRPVLWRY